MILTLGMCYNIAMADGSVVDFRFEGQDSKGTVVAESPIGSGKTIDLMALLNRGYKLVWQVNCPS